MHLVRARADTEGRCASSGTRRAFALVAVGALVTSMIGSDTEGVLRSTAADAAEPAVLVGAGDIAGSHDRDEATAKLLDVTPGTVATFGDNAYSDGTTAEFNAFYEPTWGRHKGRTRPSAGNHDYRSSDAPGYHGYFGAAAGEPGKGWYSYDLGDWHVIVLNSNCSFVGECSASSLQGQWLRADLQGSAKACTAAYWHHPLFGSGGHGGSSSVKPFWDLLYEFRADFVLNGHNHQYERFAPQTPSGSADSQNGIRQITAGTGGAGLYSFGSAKPNSEVRIGDTHGVLKVTLGSGVYDWEFIPVAGQSATDRGSGACVGGNRAPVVNAGPDQTIASGGTATLNGTVTDDGLPSNTLTTTWSPVSGPGSVTFANPNATTTTAQFGADGTYVLRLSAGDGEFTSTDDVTVTVGLPPPSPSPTPPPSGGTTFERRIATGNDDAEESSSGSVSLSSSDLELVTDSSNVQTVGLRFPNITIPAGATVTNAWVQFKVDETSTGSAPLTIKAERVANAAAFTTSSRNVSSRIRTGASASWSPPDWTAVGAAALGQRTSDLSALVQEVLAVPGWTSGNALVIILTGTGRRTAVAYNGDAAGAPLLHVEYSTGPPLPPVNQRPVVSAGPDRSIAAGGIAALDGTVTDDGLPSNTLTPTWSPVTSPGTVTFADAGAVDTTAQFSTTGIYVLRLSASDGELSAFDEMQVSVGVSTPATLDVRITNGNDDAEQSSSGSVSLSSSDLEIVTDGSTVQTVGLRFPAITIPQGATITAAWVQFKVDENPTAACSLTIQGQAVDNAPAFTTSSSNISSRARTTTNVAWSPPPWPTVGASGPDQRTPDLKSVIAQVTGRAGWASGNAIVLIITGSGKRVADSYNGDAAGAPLLHIEYTA